MRYFRDLFAQYNLKDFLYAIILSMIVLFVLDYFNLPSQIYERLGLFAVFVIAALVILAVLSLKIFDLIKLKIVNYVDFYPPVIFVSAAFFWIALAIHNQFKNTEFFLIENITFSIILVLCLLTFTARYLYITFCDKKVTKCRMDYNVYDLKALYDDDIPHNTKVFFIKDEPVDYDLLQRQRIIQQMSDTINNCRNDSRFVISLKGPWGSGKTTILKNVKRKIDSSNTIFIDDFEPWVYSNNRSLLIAFFDKIMENVDCKFKLRDVNSFTNVYLKTLDSKLGSINTVFDNINMKRVKSIINNYMISNNKKIVLVLDNLERCSSEQIIFLLKTIYGLFDFKNILYVLSYDEAEMKRHFESKLKFDYSYMEKIVQLEFNVPKLSPDVLKEVITKCLTNYLSHSTTNVSSEILKGIIRMLTSSIKDLREFKRMLNSVFNIALRNYEYLNITDLLFIEFIALKNPELWQEIGEHGIFYTSEDQYVYDNPYVFNREKFNKEATNYFDDLFNDNKYDINKYKVVLAYLFPNVQKYTDNRRDNDDIIEFISESGMVNTKSDREKYEESVVGKRIYNSKFFNLYFYKVDNEFSIMDQSIRDFINYLNNADDLDELVITTKYAEMEKIFPGWLEKYTLETFEMSIDKINKDKLKYLIYIVVLSYYRVDSQPLFFQLNAQSRTEVIIAKILNLLPDEDFGIFLDSLKDAYRYVLLIRRITYWLDPEKQVDGILDKDRYQCIKTLFETMKCNIVKNRINLYNVENYGRGNLSIFWDDQEYMGYIKKKIDINILMLFISDCIGFSTSTDGIGYIIDKKRISEYYEWGKVLEDIVHCPNCELKDFLSLILREAKPSHHQDGSVVYTTKTWRDLDSMINDFLPILKGLSRTPR